MTEESYKKALPLRKLKEEEKSKNIKKQRLPGKEKCFLGTKYPIPFAELQFDVTLFPFTKYT